ncbi:TetR/AcrR family transcriptional regulator C-terminal domain-containing protein [Tsuneonella sp. HG222]
MAAGRPKKSDFNLTVDKIVEEAWLLVDREGIARLSTRNLAAALDVKSPALYWHVRNKRQLMGLMIERALFGSLAKVPQDLPWWEWLREVARRQRRTLLSHRDSGLIASQSSPTEKLRDEFFEGVVNRLTAEGFSRNDAAAAWGGFARMVLGTVIYEQNEDTRAFADAFGDTEDSFEYCLDAYILGLREKAASPT